MKRNILLLLGLLLLAGLVYGGARGIVYWRAKQMVSEVVLQSANYAEVSYRDLEVDLSGLLVVKDINVTPHGASESVQAERLIFSGPNASFFVFNSDWKPGDKPPAHLSVNIEGIKAGIDSLSPEAFGVEPGAQGDGCSISEGPSPEIMRAMGMDSIAMDLELGYDYNEASRRLEVRFNFDIHDMESLSSTLELSDVVLDDLNIVPGREPSLVYGELEMRVEPAFAERFLTTCAERKGMTLEQFRARQVREVKREVAASGFRLGPGLEGALEQFYTEWGELLFTIDPDEAIGMMQMAFTPPDNMPKALGLHLLVNDRRVDDLSISWSGLPSDFSLNRDGDEEPREYRPRVHYTYRFVPVPKGDLVQHLQNHVRLQVRDQPEREGVLVAINQDVLQVEQRRHGGKLTAHVRLEDVQGVEVRVVEQLPSTSEQTPQQ